MLVILSGIHAASEHIVGQQTLAALNSFNLENYKIDFTNINRFTVTHPNGDVVFEANSDNVELLSGVNKAPELMARIIKLHDDLFMTKDVAVAHYNNSFLDLLYDLGITPLNNLTHKEMRTTYHDEVISFYNSRICDTFIITGSFSKASIDKFRAELGADNVVAVNIIRNPSVSYVLHKKTDAWFVENSDNDAAAVTDQYIDAIHNSVNLKKFDDIITVRYEDIINTHGYYINSKLVPMGESLVNHNGWITEYESEHIVSHGLVDASDVAAFNSDMQNYRKVFGSPVSDEAPFLKELSELVGRKITADAFKVYPADIFAELGYTPLTFDQVTS